MTYDKSPPATATDTGLNRRQLLQAMSALSLAAAGSQALADVASDDPLAGMTVVNTLGSLFGYDVAADIMKSTSNIIVHTLPGMVTDSAVRDTLASGLSAVNVTVGYVSGDADPFEHTVADIGRYDRILRQRPNQLLKVLTTQDVRRAKAERKLGVIYGFQNGEMVGDKAERADIFTDLGVRVFQLTYNKANQIGDGSMAPENRPLTAFGRQVVERLNTLPVLIDLSHSGQQTCLDAARFSKRPISISHTGCRALVDVPRNKTDEELRSVAEKGGYVGIYFMPFLAKDGQARSEHLIAHLEHAINVCGEDHVGIGTDGATSEIPNMAEYLKAQADYVAERKRQGIAAPGESGTAPFFVVDLTGPEQFRKLARLLKKKGWSTTRMEKIFGENFLRVAKEVWGA